MYKSIFLCFGTVLGLTKYQTNQHLVITSLCDNLWILRRLKHIENKLSTFAFFLFLTAFSFLAKFLIRGGVIKESDWYVYIWNFGYNQTDIECFAERSKFHVTRRQEDFKKVYDMNRNGYHVATSLGVGKRWKL